MSANHFPTHELWESDRARSRTEADSDALGGSSERSSRLGIATMTSRQDPIFPPSNSELSGQKAHQNNRERQTHNLMEKRSASSAVTSPTGSAVMSRPARSAASFDGQTASISDPMSHLARSKPQPEVSTEPPKDRDRKSSVRRRLSSILPGLVTGNSSKAATPRNSLVSVRDKVISSPIKNDEVFRADFALRRASYDPSTSSSADTRMSPHQTHTTEEDAHDPPAKYVLARSQSDIGGFTSGGETRPDPHTSNKLLLEETVNAAFVVGSPRTENFGDSIAEGMRISRQATPSTLRHQRRAEQALELASSPTSPSGTSSSGGTATLTSQRAQTLPGTRSPVIKRPGFHSPTKLGPIADAMSDEETGVYPDVPRLGDPSHRLAIRHQRNRHGPAMGLQLMASQQTKPEDQDPVTEFEESASEAESGDEASFAAHRRR